MAYVRHKVIIDLHYEKYFPGLNVSTKEPDGALWESVILPRMALPGALADPLKWTDVFVQCLDCWDLKREDGSSVPADRAGLMENDLDFIRIIVDHWLKTAIIVKRDAYGNLMSPKDAAESAPVATDEADMDVEIIEDDPLRGLQATALDIPPDLVLAEEVH